VKAHCPDVAALSRLQSQLAMKYQAERNEARAVARLLDGSGTMLLALHNASPEQRLLLEKARDTWLRGAPAPQQSDASNAEVVSPNHPEEENPS
jgi:hypothetical protein